MSLVRQAALVGEHGWYGHIDLLSTMKANVVLGKFRCPPADTLCHNQCRPDFSAPEDLSFVRKRHRQCSQHTISPAGTARRPIFSSRSLTP